jgi:hypothetical protein
MNSIKFRLTSFGIFLILVLLINCNVLAVVDIIPDDRRIEWTPGIPGGIPNYPASVNVLDYGAVPDDGGDDRQFILNAINDCPDGQTVYFPPGTYNIKDAIEVKKSIVLRGAGPELTRILYTGGSGSIIHFTKWGGDGSYININSGYSKGSTTLNLDHTSGLEENDLIYITQEDDGELVDIRGGGSVCSWCGPDEGDHCMGQIAMITSVDDSIVTIDKPMYFTYTENLNPVVIEFTNMIRDAGIEDIYVKRDQYGDGPSVWFDNAYHCWARNIESEMCGRSHILLTFSAACEIRDSYIHGGYDLGSSWGYAIFMMWSNSDHLVENNIVNHVRHHIVFEGGGSGCVLAYNYLINPEDSDYNTPSQDMSYHGAHPYMNLWEGNIGFQIAPDNTMGSNSHTTYFRNHITNKIDIDVDTGWLMWVMDIEKNSVYHNFAGNVLGYNGMEGYIYETDDCDVNRVIWHWGCPDQSGSNTDRSDEPKSTSLRHGNFDYVTNSVKWDPSIADTSLPDSYYLSARPEFFGNLQWPPIGPDVPGYTGTIPAKVRFEGGTVHVDNDKSGIPDGFILMQNYPNPFYAESGPASYGNPSTTIEYILPAYSRENPSSRIRYQESSIRNQVPVSLTIYDILGREVDTLVDQLQEPGNYKVEWDASGHTSGIYFYRICVGNYTSTRKMIYLN